MWSAASEKMRITRLVEGWHLSAHQTLAEPDSLRAPSYRRDERHWLHGEIGL